jgi:hypothetical protein
MLIWRLVLKVKKKLYAIYRVTPKKYLKILRHKEQKQGPPKAAARQADAVMAMAAIEVEGAEGSTRESQPWS